MTNYDESDLQRDGYIPTVEELEKLLRGERVESTIDTDVSVLIGVKPNVVQTPRRGGHKLFTARVTPDAHTGLKNIAAQWDLWHGGEGNVSALLQLIGDGKLIVTRPDV